jgi:hypothetical protein
MITVAINTKKRLLSDAFMIELSIAHSSSGSF